MRSMHSGCPRARATLPWMAAVLLGSISFRPPCFAQENQSFTLKASTQLVVESVVVRDKDGKNVEGLSAEDFILTEDDQRQEISVFEFNRIDDAPAATPVPDNAIPGRQLQYEHREPYQSTQGRGNPYQNRRLLVLFFDMTTMQQWDQYRSFLAAAEFIKESMTKSDLVSILVYVNGAITTLMDFTDDRSSLLNAIERMMYHGDDDRLFNTGAFGQDSNEFNIFNTDRRLAALQTAVSMLRGVREKKYLVYVSSGLRLNGMENQAQIRATINAAVRANVAFFPIDARGLEAFAPLGDASQASPGGIGMYTGASALNTYASFQSSQDTLYALAEDTGGAAFLDNNDLVEGIRDVQMRMTSYYTIGYYPTKSVLDGKFRRVKIALREMPHAKLEYRGGYYAGKSFEQFNEYDKERQLEEAFMLGDPITEIPIAMEINYFKVSGAEYFVPVHVKMPGSELLLAGDRGSGTCRMDFIGEIKDNYGNTIQSMRDKVDVKIGKERIQVLAKQPIQYDTGFTVISGTYVIKFLARNKTTGRIGTYQASFAVPNLTKPSNVIPISSVIVGNQSADMREAVYSSGKDEKARAQTANPLVINGRKLIPSVTRVFSKSREMFIYLQAYPHDSGEGQRIVVYAGFYRNQSKAFETRLVSVGIENALPWKVLPLRLNLSLSTLPVGEYSLVVSVLEPKGQRAAFWNAPIMLVP